MVRKLATIATTVFLVGGDTQTVMLELLVLFGILIASLLLQARTRGSLVATHAPPRAQSLKLRHRET